MSKKTPYTADDILRDLGLSTGDLESLKKSDHKKPPKVGGFAFYLSLAVILVLSTFNVALLPSLIGRTALINWAYFAAAAALGCAVSHFLIRDRFSVFLHELRHSIMSNIVGNKAKGMSFHKQTGKFEYEYTKSTAHMNAFIALAPYFLPVFTFIGLLVGYLLFRQHQPYLIVLAGLGYGMDLVLNFRDISDVQTDITEINGGYRVGLMYIFAANLFIFGYLAAWVCLGTDGLKHLVLGLYSFALMIIQRPV
jgi:hypothetical protein